MHTVVITNVDSYFGYVLANTMLQCLQNTPGLKDQQEIRLMCKDRKGLEQLERQGGKIIQVNNYNDEQRLKEHFKNVQAVLLLPEHDTQMAEEGQHTIKAARQANVEYFCMFSYMAADRAQEGILQEFYQLEKLTQQTFPDKHCVIRMPMFNQVFYYMVPMVEDHNALNLCVQPDKRWGTVDVREVCEAIVRLSQSSHEKRRPFCPFASHKNFWQFTPKQNKNAQEMAQCMGRVLQRDVECRKISEQEMIQYLSEIRNDRRYRERPQENQRRMQDTGRDNPQSFPLGHYLTDQNIRGIVQYWKLADQDKVNVVTNDLQEALGREPQELEAYFETNGDQFRRLK